MQPTALGQSIRSRRELLRLRQDDLAGMSGVTIRTIHLIESGNGNPSLGTLVKISTVLGMELSLRVKSLQLPEEA